MTHRKILLDSNILINAVKSEALAQTDQERMLIQQSKQTLRQVLSADNVVLMMTPLLRYEVLRGIKKPQERARLEQILQAIPVFEISREIGDLATHLYPLRVTAGMNPNKYNFDLFHFATAKTLGCDIETHDGGFEKLEELYANWQSSNPSF